MNVAGRKCPLGRFLRTQGLYFIGLARWIQYIVITVYDILDRGQSLQKNYDLFLSWMSVNSFMCTPKFSLASRTINSTVQISPKTLNQHQLGVLRIYRYYSKRALQWMTQYKGFFQTQWTSFLQPHHPCQGCSSLQPQSESLPPPFRKILAQLLTEAVMDMS